MTREERKDVATAVRVHAVCLVEWYTAQACHPFLPSPLCLSVEWGVCPGLAYQCILEPHKLPGFTGSQLERNCCLKMNRTLRLISFR